MNKCELHYEWINYELIIKKILTKIDNNTCKLKYLLSKKSLYVLFLDKKTINNISPTSNG